MIKHIIAAAALAAVAASSQAGEPGTMYGGADLGVTRLGPGDHSQTSYGAFLGYNLNKNFALEANYRRLYSMNVYGYGSKGDQAALSLIASQPLTESLSLYGRIGVSRLKETFTDGPNKYTNDSTRLLPGFGLSYKITEKVQARVEVQRPGRDLTNVSTGVSYAF